MHKWLFLTAVLFVSSAQAQGDMVVIRKHNQSIKTFMAGSFVTFFTASGEEISANIASIRNDSLFFREVQVRQVMTNFGVPRLDTVATGLRGIHYQEIAALPKPRKFSQLSIPKLLMVGGAGFVAINLANSIYLNYPPFEKDNFTNNLLPAFGAFVTGFAISKLTSSYYAIGKKYTVQYIQVGAR